MVARPRRIPASTAMTAAARSGLGGPQPLCGAAQPLRVRPPQLAAMCRRDHVEAMQSRDSPGGTAHCRDGVIMPEHIAQRGPADLPLHQHPVVRKVGHSGSNGERCMPSVEGSRHLPQDAPRSLRLLHVPVDFGKKTALGGLPGPGLPSLDGQPYAGSQINPVAHGLGVPPLQLPVAGTELL